MPFSAIRRWHRRWFIPIEIGLLLLIVAVWWINSRSPMAKLRASGAPTTFADLVVDPIPDEENAAVVLRDATPAIDAFSKDLSAFYQSETGVAFEQVDPMEPLSDATAAVVRQLLLSHDALAKALREVAQCPSHVTTTPVDRRAVEAAMEAIPRWRTLARYATLKQRVALAEGDLPAAFAATAATLRLGAHLANEPLMMRRLVAVAISSVGMHQAERLLAIAEPASDLWSVLSKELAETEDRPPVRRALDAERVFALDRLAQFPAYQGLFYRGGVLEEFDRVLALAELPTHEAATAIRKQPPPASPLAPSLDPLLTAETRLLAHSRCLRVAIALSQQTKPTDLSKIGLPAETLIDPFTGRPLLIKPTREPEGWRVVSAGPDQLLGEEANPTEAADNIAIEFSSDR